MGGKPPALGLGAAFLAAGSLAWGRTPVLLVGRELYWALWRPGAGEGGEVDSPWCVH